MGRMELPHNHGGNGEFFVNSMPDIKDFGTITELFKILSDPSRTRIFWLLCHCRECVVNISALVGMSSPAVSHHLKQLKAQGLIEGIREGKEVYYTSSHSKEALIFHDVIENIIELKCPEN